MIQRPAIFIALVLLASACGNGPGTQSTSAGAGSLLTTTPPASKAIDQLVWALPWEPTPLDPIHDWTYSENQTVANMCEGLVALAPDFSIQNNLASDVNVSDPLKIVYTIRPGVTFWDGNPLTADDVAYSLNRNLDPKAGSYFSGFFGNVKSIDVSGPMQVTVSLTQADVLLPQVLAISAGAISEKAFVIKSGAAYGAPNIGVMCTGPFKFGSWVPGQSITMLRNDSYWNPKLRPFARQVVFKFIPDVATVVSALQTGEVQGAYVQSSGASALNQLKAIKSGKLYLGRSTNALDLIVSRDGPLADARLRTALSLAIDRTAIAKVVYDGAAEPSRSLTPPNTWGYAPNVFQQGYNLLTSAPATPDLQKAKALVAQVGVPADPIVIKAYVGDFSAVALVVASAAQQLGFKTKVVTTTNADFNNLFFDPKARAGITIFPTTWQADVADPLIVWSAVAGPGGAGNYNNFANSSVTDNLKLAFQASDPAKRAGILNTVQSEMLQDMDWIPLVSLTTILYMNNAVTGAPASLPTYLYSPWAALVGAP